jgi:hypothetical protein
VSGAYQATPIKRLETETYVPLLDIYLDSRLAGFCKRLENSGQAAVIRQACAGVQAKLRTQGPRLRGDPGARSKALDEWAERWTRGGARGRQAPSKTPGARRIILHHWKERWKKAMRLDIDERRRACEEPAPNRLQLHERL